MRGADVAVLDVERRPVHAFHVVQRNRDALAVDSFASSASMKAVSDAASGCKRASESGDRRLPHQVGEMDSLELAH